MFGCVLFYFSFEISVKVMQKGKERKVIKLCLFSFGVSTVVKEL